MMLRSWLIACVTLTLFVAPASATDVAKPSIEVWRSATCKCCMDWVKHLEANGFDVKVTDTGAATLARLKREAGIPSRLASCHTAKIDGYVVEGHVPAADIKRFMSERPDAAIGLAVPGMPIGSPGMERGDKSEPYDVLLVRKDGTNEVYASH